MKVRLRALQKNEPIEVYQLFQTLPAMERGFDNPAFGLSLSDFETFVEKNLQMASGIGLDRGYATHTIYIFYADDRPVGISKIRTYSDNALLKRGGHIGCAITPTLRGKGLGSLLLRETIKEARKKGVKDILVGCYSDNLPSVHMIKKNGGVLEEDKNNISWFWIKTSPAEKNA